MWKSRVVVLPTKTCANFARLYENSEYPELSIVETNRTIIGSISVTEEVRIIKNCSGLFEFNGDLTPWNLKETYLIGILATECARLALEHNKVLDK